MDQINRYALPESEYTVKNALLWGNFKRHAEKAWQQNSWGHGLIAAIEFFPGLSQLASLVELAVMKYWHAHRAVVPNPQPRPLAGRADAPAPNYKQLCRQAVDAASKGDRAEARRVYDTIPPSEVGKLTLPEIEGLAISQMPDLSRCRSFISTIDKVENSGLLDPANKKLVLIAAAVANKIEDLFLLLRVQKSLNPPFPLFSSIT